MPAPAPKHSAVFVVDLAQDLLKQGFPEQEVFLNSGLSTSLLEQDNPSAGFDQIARFFENAARLTEKDELGFICGQSREERRSGLITYIGLSSPTVMDLIRNTARYRRVFSEAIELDIDRLEQDGMLGWYFAVPTRVRRRQYVEFSASGFINSVRQNTNRTLRPELVTFRHARKTNLAKFEQFFGCEVRFGATANMIRFRPSDLSLPLVTADNYLHAVLVRYCEDVLSDQGRNISPLIVEVERAIAGLLASGEATQEIVARKLGMSPRTLARRLAVNDMTFFQVLEELRLALATSYLKDSEFSLAEIAFLLGYSGVSSFNDAFKRWTAQTPGQYRSSQC